MSAEYPAYNKKNNFLGFGSIYDDDHGNRALYVRCENGKDWDVSADQVEHLVDWNRKKGDWTYYLVK